MSELLNLLGPERLAVLSTKVGGIKLYVPKNAGKPARGGRNGFERLKGMFGEEIAILLVFHFGDSQVYVPRPRRSEPIDEDKLKRLERRGLSARRIAAELGCSERTIEYRRERRRPGYKPKARRRRRK